MNYLELNELHETYSSDGLVILGFPCNQFGHQEWPKEEEIPLSLKYVRPGNDYEPLFQLFSKIEVNGANTHDVYQFLRDRCVTPRSDLSDELQDVIWEPISVSDLSWNFEKFLINRDGIPVYRYPDKWDPIELAEDIEELLRS